MTREETATAIHNLKREIGRYDQNKPGVTVIAIGGMHGNEPAGVLALQKVLDYLNEHKPRFSGQLIGLAGNLKALESGERFIDRDLNRMWFVKPSGALCQCDQCAEKEEFNELKYHLKKEINSAENEILFFDMHTTSAASQPFLMIGDTIRNRKMVDGLPAPIILGVEEQLDGPLLSYINELGHWSVGFEAGQHDDKNTVYYHEAMLWLLLEKAGCIDKFQIPDYQLHYDTLKDVKRDLKKFYEVRLRHSIEEEDDFEMKPGYFNFKPIQKGEKLAEDRNGVIKSPEKGNIFMPLYQSKGKDGFFIIRAVSPFWLELSAGLRRLNIYHLLPLLPGVNKVKSDINVLAINTKIAKFLSKEFFHLFGYRKSRRVDSVLIMERRKYDFSPPPRKKRK
jgi:hypothetical protein